MLWSLQAFLRHVTELACTSWFCLLFKPILYVTFLLISVPLQPAVLGLHRADYMLQSPAGTSETAAKSARTSCNGCEFAPSYLHQVDDEESLSRNDEVAFLSACQYKQIEINTIAVGFGGLGSLLPAYHRYVHSLVLAQCTAWSFFLHVIVSMLLLCIALYCCSWTSLTVWHCCTCQVERCSGTLRWPSMQDIQ